ncbi:sensor histidine kinase [Actinomadura madurae]|uniref:Sensor-like histidine kinase SenX3 n=1 Tax=Actinomadura madurae TaxID=1993 RepID=A0A1I5J687_9ACTN|nr:HAMP domain-containing sensor histidine kinase [Actinomadura madurae]SFO68123.1 Signal transduction histidine kinase [Actinomadura madurae]SPT58678.1 Globin-coupled histidine kinase [Actinomadura madurae]
MTGLVREAGAPREPGPVPDAERLMLARARRRVTAEAAGTIAVLVGAAAWDVRRTAAPDLDAAARRRLLWTFAAAEAGGALAALLIGRATARRALAPAHAALARRERFAAEVTHELRAPLARLHTRAQLAARRLRNGTDVAAEMDRLVADTGRLGEVVDDVLRSTRPGRRPTGPVDLAGLAAELAASERARARERGVAIEVSRKGRRHVVQGAEPALRRVLSSLVDNALGHAAPGGHVWVTLAGTAAAVEVSVRDDGPGLDPDDAGRLFGRHGGLGLALAREVVDGHGGTLTADGRPGAGAVFTVRLPAAPAHVGGGL